MLRTSLFGGLLLLPIVFSSCESAEEKADRRAINLHTDSLAATGAHGYYVATFYVGRYKNTRTERTPFQVRVERIHTELIARPLELQFREGGRYELNYELPGSKVPVMGTVGEVLDLEDLEIEVGPDENGDAWEAYLKSGAYGSYVLKVYPY